MNPASQATRFAGGVWLILLGGYAAASVWVPAGASRTAVQNILLCLMPLLVNGALLINAVSPDWRKKAFWMLLAIGCSLWMAGQAIRTYAEVYHHASVPELFSADIVFFLHTVPMIAALSVLPHRRSDGHNSLFGYVDFGLMLCWWLYLYVFVVIPWQFIAVDEVRYHHAYSVIAMIENLVFVGGAVLLSTKARGYWRRIYVHLAASGAVYILGVLAAELIAGRNTDAGISIYNWLLLISFLWLGTVGIIAHQTGEEDAEPASGAATQSHAAKSSSSETLWASRLARGALLSLPVIGFWCARFSDAPMPVHQFRILLTLAAVLPLGFLAFLRHELVDGERLRLLRASQESLDNLKRLQMHFVQSEKLASIGQLVGGAAHEINNPLTAILGYSELLADDPSSPEKARTLAEKIREQARRTKTLVNNLLSFARQAPSEQRVPINVNTIVNTSVQFRRFDLRGKNIRIEVQTGAPVPDVRADANQLVQVFTNIINNAVDAMEEVGGGTLTVRTQFEKGSVVILFSDTGPGMREPRLVFDPFYTTKPVGKGTGLGLSICYGLVREQGGQISCYNRPEGGATFRVELPAVSAAFPFPPRSVAPPTRNDTAKLA